MNRLNSHAAALATVDHNTPSPSRFAEMLDEPYTEPAPLPTRRNRPALVVIYHSAGHVTTEPAQELAPLDFSAAYELNEEMRRADEATETTQPRQSKQRIDRSSPRLVSPT
jgi:hypothetical protein